jgi:sulfur-oxidizing protein SoxZ
MTNVRVSVPARAKRGEVIDIRTLVSHTMETGFRRTHLGTLIARDIITTFTCRYNGVEVFRAELHPSISANPYLHFTTVATESGTLEFQWTGDNGFTTRHVESITVT